MASSAAPHASPEAGRSCRVVVTGGRDFADAAAVQLALLAALRPGDTLVHGGAAGADALCARWARTHGYAVEAWPAKWAEHGRAAGPRRNAAMLDAGARVLVAFPGGRGTADCVRQARRRNIPVLGPGASSAS